ncbi:uncharacterized protein PAC_04694 [Phialocephala subalpina]|uniref:Uncharacterized protein n=1 Tax=Phialocephala subalpina TaxID=576137 RepID=A0A1L7WPV9_9HELO|nr:uncharacterized protein PAC_04694 [Phialocephala subalpina]
MAPKSTNRSSSTNATSHNGSSTKATKSQDTPMGRWMSEGSKEGPWNAVDSAGKVTYMGTHEVEVKENGEEDSWSMDVNAQSEKYWI